MNAYILECHAGAFIPWQEAERGDATATQIVMDIASHLGRFINARLVWIGGEDGGFHEVHWDRAMFLADQCDELDFSGDNAYRAIEYSGRTIY